MIPAKTKISSKIISLILAQIFLAASLTYPETHIGRIRHIPDIYTQSNLRPAMIITALGDFAPRDLRLPNRSSRRGL